MSERPRIRKFVTSLAALLLLIGAYFAYQRLRPPRVRNVLLISMDTTRADHLSCYGVLKNATPNIDALAKDGVLFQNAYSAVSLTLPSHSTMMTGVYPPRHGVHDNLEYRLADSHQTLAEQLSAAGLSTAAVISTFVLDSRFGLDQGFDTYDDEFDEELESAHIAQRRGSETTAHAIDWLQANGEDPFFLFVHYYDPHFPYDPPEPFKSKILHPYVAEIAYTDHCIGRIIGKLKQLNLYDSTLIVLTGDHGEMLGEHEEITHGYFLYQGNIRIPLIIRMPGLNKTKVVPDICGNVDVAPTICSLLGVDAPGDVQGVDLSEYLLTKTPSASGQRFLYCESLLPTKYMGNSLLGLVSQRYKYIQTTRPELYDLVRDPLESVSLVDAHPELVQGFQEELKHILESSSRKENPEGEIELDADSLRKLEALGYIAGNSVDEEFTFDDSKEDPKDLIQYHLKISGIMGMVHAGDLDDAEQLCAELIAENKERLLGQLYRFMSVISRKKNDYPKAVTYLEKLVQIDPERADVYIEYGSALLHLGRTPQAEIRFDKARALQPENERVCSDIAKAYYDTGDLMSAIKYCRLAVELNPDFILARTSLADTLFRTRQIDLAVEQYYEVIQRAPRNLEALNALAWILATSRSADLANPPEAVRLAERACAVVAVKSPELLDTLAAAYASNAQFDEAIESARQAIDLARQEDSRALAGRITKRLALYLRQSRYTE